MIDQGKFYSLTISDQWRLFRDDQDRLENTKIELLALRNKFENLTAEVETLRARLVKAEKVIAVAGKGPCRHAHDKNSCELCEALKEYREEETK